jgi:putative transposase
VKTIRTIQNRKRIRLKDFDYSNDGSYYVTICVQGHIKCFGHVRNDKIELNNFGKIVNRQFEWMQNQYSYIKIAEYIVMPDHIHAIIEINRNFINENGGTGRDLSLQNPRDLSLQQPNIPDNPQQIKIKPLPELVGAFKTTSSKKIHESGFADFRWQRSYYEWIIRNKIQYTRISEYIRNNPVMSGLDRTDTTTGRNRTKGEVMSGRDRTK